MGTRSLIRVFDENEEILCLYRQFDGYPAGRGAILAAILKDRTIVNGIRLDGVERKISNGMGCLAATIVAEEKTDVGGVYVYAPGSPNQEFVYEVRGAPGEPIMVRVTDRESRELFSGNAEEFAAMCAADTP